MRTFGNSCFIQPSVEGGAATAARQAGSGMGRGTSQALGGLWALGEEGRGQMCFLKMAVPMKGPWRRDEVVEVRGGWLGLDG